MVRDALEFYDLDSQENMIYLKANKRIKDYSVGGENGTEENTTIRR